MARFQRGKLQIHGFKPMISVSSRLAELTHLVPGRYTIKKLSNTISVYVHRASSFHSQQSSHFEMLRSSVRSFVMKRWFKATDVKPPDLFKVGTQYSEEKFVTPDLANNRSQLGRYVISTASITSTLHVLACAAVDDTIPSNCHALTRHTQLVHREPACVGEKMELGIRVQKGGLIS
jgi:hypothetical protein